MTTINIDGGTQVRARPRLAFLTPLKRLLVIWRRRQRIVRYNMDLARLDERLLYDIGLEPLNLHDALKQRLPPSMLLDAMRSNLDRQIKRRS
jgi:uncharacterized protein YjiS (DUF1127 family)